MPLVTRRYARAAPVSKTLETFVVLRVPNIVSPPLHDAKLGHCVRRDRRRRRIAYDRSRHRWDRRAARGGRGARRPSTVVPDRGTSHHGGLAALDGSDYGLSVSYK